MLDEADRLLDLGFLPALRAIISHFSSTSSGRPDRQTLLFSATQSKDLATLAKLSLHHPLYINCNKPGEEGVVPSNLEQFYAVVGLEKKLDALWGFVKSHLKMKGVVFVASGKQARYPPEVANILGPLHIRDVQEATSRSSPSTSPWQAETTHSTRSIRTLLHDQSLPPDLYRRRRSWTRFSRCRLGDPTRLPGRCGYIHPPSRPDRAVSE